jgi:hypothetical protein
MFCLNHALMAEETNSRIQGKTPPKHDPAPPKPDPAPPKPDTQTKPERRKQQTKPERRKKAVGFLRQFNYGNEEVIRDITGIVEVEMDHMNLSTGHRVFSYLTNQQFASVEPMLELIVDQARLQVSFPLKTNTRIQQIVLVVAPPEGTRSNSWTRGKIHRDFSSPEVSGVYTFLLCLDEVTNTNGAIQIWRESKSCPHNNKTPIRGLDGLVVQTLLGPKNTVFVWDSRLLHQPLPNKSTNARIVLIWLVNSQSKPAVAEF